MGALSWDAGADRPDEDSEAGLNSPTSIVLHPAAKDAMRSWLVRGIHPFAVAARRSGTRRNASRVLGDDQRMASDRNGGWRELASALQRHTLHNALIHLDPQERHIVTLAYLQGRTNRQIAALLGISVSTVSRRLSHALDHLDEYVSRTRGWITATMLVGLGYLSARAGRAVNGASAGEWTHRVAATVAVGTVAVVSVGLVATSPDSAVSRQAPASSGLKVVATPWDVTRLPLLKVRPLGTTSDTSTVAKTSTSTTVTAVTVAASTTTKAPTSQPVEVNISGSPNQGCHGRPSDVDTNALDHPEGPVVHLAAGGCQK